MYGCIKLAKLKTSYDRLACWNGSTSYMIVHGYSNKALFNRIVDCWYLFHLGYIVMKGSVQTSFLLSLHDHTKPFICAERHVKYTFGMDDSSKNIYFFTASHSATAVASAPSMRPFGITPCPFAITCTISSWVIFPPIVVKSGPTPPRRSPPWQLETFRCYWLSPTLFHHHMRLIQA